MPRDDDVERALHLGFGKSEHLGGIGGRLSSRQVSREHEDDGDGHVMEVYVNRRRRNPSRSGRISAPGMQPSDTDRYRMYSEAPLPSWLTALLDEAGSDTLILKAGDPPYVVRSGSALSSEHGTAYPGVDGSACPGHLVRRWAAPAGCQRKSPACPAGPRFSVEVRADRLDDQLVVRLRRLGETEHVKSAEDATADLVAELGAAAKTPEVEAAIDALRQRLHTSGGAARDAERKEETTAATVVELHRRREIATDKLQLRRLGCRGGGARSTHVVLAGGQRSLRED